MRADIPSLILITDNSRYAEEILFEALEPALQGGVDAVLLREKELSSAKLLALASKLRALTAIYGAKLYIHTQADIATAVDADGVHVASGDITNIPAIRRWLNDPGKSLSASCHTVQELQLAEEQGADFAFLSPLFATDSHPGAPHLGISTFKRTAAATKLPVVALGGINTENCHQLKGWRVAVIGAILAADDPAAAARKMRAGLSQEV